MNDVAVKRLISLKRMASYENLAHYEKNLKVSKQYYIALSVLEVALRNSINVHFERFYGAGWLVNEAPFLRNDLLSKIADAKEKLQGRNEAVTKDKLIAELSFGFWTALFQSPYKEKMRLTDLRQIFPNMPKKNEEFIDRKIVSSKSNVIRKFRNRVFHYEKIIDKEEFQNIDQKIEDILRWLDKDLPAFVQRLNDE